MKPALTRSIYIGALALLLVLCVALIVHLYPQRVDESSEGTAAIGGPFALTDQDGKRFTSADLAGQYQLVYFGYTFCPDACPTALSAMTQALNQLGTEGDKVTPVFITIDPERDSQEAMKAYAANFHPRLKALRGTPEEIAAAARAYRVYYKKAEADASGNYEMDHTTLIYLMGPDGRYRTHFAPEVSPEEMTAKIKKYLESNN